MTDDEKRYRLTMDLTLDELNRVAALLRFDKALDRMYVVSKGTQKPAEAPAPFKLESGKRYVTRDGRVSGPVEVSDFGDIYPFRTEIPGHGIATYMVDGHWHRGFDTHRLDLVALYHEDTQVGKR